MSKVISSLSSPNMMAMRVSVLLWALFVATASEPSSVLEERALHQISVLTARVKELEGIFEQVKKESSQNHQTSIEMLGQTAKLNEKKDSSESSRRLTIEDAVDHLWLILCGALVMFMQAGFAMVEAGCCRCKNVQNILMKNLVDVCVGTICWWAFGWMLAYGFDSNDKKDVFAGHLQYFGHEFGESDSNGNQTPSALYRDWFFQWAFCATAATIVSGGVAERIQMPAYLLMTIAMTSFIYPIVVAWMWSSNGWLTKPDKDVKKHLNEVGFTDFAGSGIVHMTGGVGALVGAIVVGPRKGRFDGTENFDPHSLPLIVLGTFILWFGWYGFNCGSTLGMSKTSAAHQGAIVAMNTTLAASVGGLTVLVIRLLLSRSYDIGGMCNGILAGLVSITAGCGNVDCGWAIFIGIVGGLIYQGSSSLLQRLKVDDPIDAFAVHGASGAWGVMAAAIFDWGAGLDKFNGFAGGLTNIEDWNGKTDGLWISGVAANLVEVLVVLAWVGGLSSLVFLPLRILGILRAPDDMQEQGMDQAKHSPVKAYSLKAADIAVEVKNSVAPSQVLPTISDNNMTPVLCSASSRSESKEKLSKCET